MAHLPKPKAISTGRGLGLAALAFALLTIQDAILKLLAATYPITEVLFMRSVFIVAAALLMNYRGGGTPLHRSRNQLSLVVRAVLVMVAWFLFSAASRELGLAELTTICFVAPIIVVTLSVILLGETVSPARWLMVVLGFVGVTLAASPSQSVGYVPAAMVLGAAIFWALNSVLVRRISHLESTANQLLASNGLFVVFCAVTFPWVWRTPDPQGCCLFVALAITGGVGQYFLFEAFRITPASVIAPLEYTGLIWAFVLGYVVFGSIPPVNVFAGAAIIAFSSLALVWTERRKARITTDDAHARSI